MKKSASGEDGIARFSYVANCVNFQTVILVHVREFKVTTTKVAHQAQIRSSNGWTPEWTSSSEIIPYFAEEQPFAGLLFP